MTTSRRIAAFIVGMATVVGLVLALDRGGLIAWSTLLIGLSLLAKISFKPSRSDLKLGVGLVAFAVLAWIGTHYYVISTYESGEVVELVIDTDRGPHTVRLWVLDIRAYPTVYYDAEPKVADALLSGKPVQFTRAGKVSTRMPKATPVEALPEHEASQMLEVMKTKYGHRFNAANINYLMLGRPRNRVDLVVHLHEA